MRTTLIIAAVIGLRVALAVWQHMARSRRQR
jgi:hypothetical protein